MGKIFSAVFGAICVATFLNAKPVVTTSILPTKFFVEQIAGDTVNVNVMVGYNADPHTYEPKPEQMKSLEKSDIFFAVGIEYEENWLPKFKKSFPNLIISNTQDGITLMAMQEHHHHDEEEHHHDADHDHDKDEHHHEGHHHHDGLDPHVWLDPILVKTQAKNIADALIKKYPQNKALYEANLSKFEASLDDLNKQIYDILSDVKNRKFIVYHPSWGYFAKRYNLIQIPIEIEGKEPKIGDLKELIDEAKEEGTKVIFVAPQFSKKSANIIAKEVGANVVEIDQLSYDYINNMLKTARAFENSLK